jgi:hypothetical protein
MILTTMLGLTALGQVLLPGSGVPLERAKEEAGLIVVATVGKTGDRLAVPGRAFLLWAELKPSAVLKGEVTAEELNSHPLALKALGAERLPKTGDELVFFLRDFVITKVLPKTEAVLAAIKAPTVPRPPGPERGGPDHGLMLGGGNIGGGNLGGDIAPGAPARVIIPPEAPPSYRGTMIVPDPKAEGETLKLQNEFAAAMSRADPEPEERRAHFSWLDENECIRRYRVARLGWYGGVIGWKPRPDGGWLVTVAIRPWLYSMQLKTVLFDSVEETYEFVGGRVRLIGSNAAIPKPGNQVFPGIL